MQFEDREIPENRNERPKEANRNLPMAVLLVLIGVICALLYIGWKYMADDTPSNDELTTAPADTVANAIKKMSEEEDVSNNTSPTEEVPTVTIPKVENNSGDKTEKESPKTDTNNGLSHSEDGEIYTHTVGEGETFFGIANRYNIKKETLKSMNSQVNENGIKVGVTKLKIKVKAIHTVGPGDIIRVVSNKYDVSQELIMQANKKTKNIATRGEKLIIPFADKQ